MSINVQDPEFDSPFSLKKCFQCNKSFHKKCFEELKRQYYTKNTRTKTSRPDFRNCLMCNQCDSLLTKTLKDITINEYFKSDLNNKETTEKSNKAEGDIVIKLNENDILYDSLGPFIEKFQDFLKLKSYKDICQKLNKKLKESMLQSMLIKDYKFCDDLVYPNEEVKKMNNSSKEPGLFQTSEHNKNIYYEVKAKTRNGNYCGLEISGDEAQGFLVKAAVDIPSCTFLCEYAGEVCLQRKVFFDSDNDSIMELLKTPSSSESLVIKPEKYCNIARFISGINNHKPESYKKINVNSVKVNIDGQAHILLYASRYIKQGDVLYYDYNRGGYEYPTENFV